MYRCVGLCTGVLVYLQVCWFIYRCVAVPLALREALGAGSTSETVGILTRRVSQLRLLKLIYSGLRTQYRQYCC